MAQAEIDRKVGYADRMMGYYDEWYKHNRKNGGKAYDEGVAKAAEDPNCCESCIVFGNNESEVTA